MQQLKSRSHSHRTFENQHAETTSIVMSTPQKGAKGTALSSRFLRIVSNGTENIPQETATVRFTSLFEKKGRETEKKRRTVFSRPSFKAEARLFVAKE
jgi:hypothetical protein